MSTATDTPAADEQPETLAFEETKFPDKTPSPHDKFEALSFIPGMGEIRRVNNNPEQNIFARSELELVGIRGLARYCLERTLKPLTETAPEVFGLTIAEMLEQYLPTGNERSRRFEALFRLLRDPSNAAPELAAICPQSNNTKLLADEGFKLLFPELLPSVLPVLIEEAFRDVPNFNEREVQALARRFILEAPPGRFSGKGAHSILGEIVKLLDRTTAEGFPRYGDAIGIRLMEIMSANAPIHQSVRGDLLRALRRYQHQTAPEWAAEARAAIECEYQTYFR